MPQRAPRDEIEDFIDRFKASLDDEQKKWIGAPLIRSVRSYKFKVRVDPETIWEVKEIWGQFVASNDEKLSGETPRFIVERSPEAQKVFDKMGATWGKLQKKLKAPLKVTADWRIREFLVHKEGEEDNKKELVKVADDLSLEWFKDGVEMTGFREEELVKAVA